MKQKLLHMLYIIVGNILIAFALSTLIIENNIIAGGVSGIGIIFNHYFGLSISMSVGIINVILFILGLSFIGVTFAMTTLISTFIFPFLLEFFESQQIFHHYLEDPFLACILGGCLIGIGVGLVLKANASTGGVDIIALLVNKKFGIPVHIILYILDLTVLVFQFSFNDTTHVIYGVVTVCLTSVVLNKTLTTGTSLIQITIMSDFYDEIRHSILNDYDAGVTLLASEKGFSQEHSKLIMSVIPYRKLPSVKEKVNQIDPLAFIIVSHVEEVNGKGFTLEKRV